MKKLKLDLSFMIIKNFNRNLRHKSNIIKRNNPSVFSDKIKISQIEFSNLIKDSKGIPFTPKDTYYSAFYTGILTSENYKRFKEIKNVISDLHCDRCGSVIYTSDLNVDRLCRKCSNELYTDNIAIKRVNKERVIETILPQDFIS